MTRPSIGDIWPAYSTQRIEWTSSNIDNIMIESSLDSGRTWSVIVNSYPASAQYFPWEVPNKISDSCYIRISDVLNSSTSSSNKGKPFKIPAPSVKVDSLGSIAIAKTVLPITWVSIGIKRISIYASFNNKTSFIKIADSVSAYNFYYNWIVPDSIGLNCFIRIVNTDDSSVVDTSSTSIVIAGLVNGTTNKFKGGAFDGHTVSNNLKKQITLQAPNKVDSLFGSSLYIIQWKQNNIDQVNLKFSPDNGISWKTIINQYPATANKYEWTVPNTPTGIALVKIEDFSDTTVFDNSDTNFVIREKLLKIGQPDSTTVFYRQTALPISWTSGGISFIKAYTLVGTDLKLIMDSIPANYESVNKILKANLSDSFRIVLADVSDSTMRDTSALLVTKTLASADKIKYHGGAFDGHTVASNGKKSLKLLSPVGGEIYSVINKYDIKWRSENLERISIDFSSDSGKNWMKIDSGITSSTNTYSWKTPNSPSNKCLIRLRNDFDSSLQSISDSVFVLTSKKIINNTDSLNWVRGTAKSIEWTALGVDTIRLSYKNGNQQNWIKIKDTLSASNETYNWIIPNSLVDSIWIQIADMKDSAVKVENFYVGNLSSLNNSFSAIKFHGGSFDGHTQRSNLNRLIVKRPAENEVLIGGATYEIKWSTVNFEDSVLLQYSIDSGATWVSITKTMASLGVYNWNIPLSFSIIGAKNEVFSFKSGIINKPLTVVTTNINSNKCLIRALNISDGNSLIGISAKPFTILTTAAPNKNDLIFPIIKDTIYSQDLMIKLKATNTKNIPVKYAIIAGSATLQKDSLIISKPGSYTVAAFTPADSTHLASDSIYQQFCIYPLSPTIAISGAGSLCMGDSSLLISTNTGIKQWYLDSNKIQGATDILIKIKSSGSYRVTTSIEGCSSTLSSAVPILFNAIPAIPVISNSRPLVFASNDSTILTSSVGSGNQWLLNGVPISSATASSYTVKTSGNYTVRVVNTSGCSATSLPVNVNANLVPGVTPVISNNRPLSFCEGDSTILTSSIAYGNQWYLDTIKIYSDTAQSIVAKKSGVYKVVNNNIASASVAVTVNQLPTVPVITASRPLVFIQGDSTILSSSSTNGNQWLLNGIAIDSAKAQIYIAKTSGTYSVKVVNASGCSATSLSVTVVANVAPVIITPVISNNRPLSFCDGDSTVLTSSIVYGNQWYLDGTLLISDTVQTIIAKKTGKYVVVNKAVSSIGVSVTVHALPATPIITNIGPLTFLEGDSTKLVSSSGQENQWFFNTVLIPGAINQNLIAKQAGDYSVQVVNAFGCSSNSNKVAVIVNPIPLPLITSLNALVFCTGDSALLTSSMNTGNLWMKDGVAISGATNKNLIVKSSGDYTVTNKVNGISIKSIPISVIANPIPAKPIITSNLVRVLVSSASKGNQWYVDTITAIFAETNVSFKPTVNGLYSVKVTENGCVGPFSDKFNYQDRSSVTANMDSVVNIYPNPTHNLFVVTFNTAVADRVKVELLDFNGKLTFTKPNIKDKDQIDISALTPGIYTVTIYDSFGNLICSKKILKL